MELMETEYWQLIDGKLFSIPEELLKFNPNHDKVGRFSTGTNGGGGLSDKQNLQYPTEMAYPELKDTLKDYIAEYPSQLGHAFINITLRGQSTATYTNQINSLFEDRVSRLDKLVELSPPQSEPTTSYRGIGLPFAMELEKMGIGATYTDKGFVSVSLDKGIALGFPSRPTGNLLEIVLPKGTRAINPSKFFKRNIIRNTDLKQEKELILGRGNRFTILEIKDNTELGVGKIIKIEVKK